MVDTIPEEGLSLVDTAERKEPRAPAIAGPAAAFLSDPKVWANYENEELAECEEILRAWIAEMRKVKSWAAPNTKRRRYTFSMLFEILTGEKYDQRKHSKQVRIWTTLFKYYSSRVQKAGSINGKTYTKTIYNISPKRLDRPPYSVRLRIPWLIEHDMAFDQRTMVNICDDIIEPGHARNPRTDENMRRRREEGRRRYDEKLHKEDNQETV